MKSIVFFLIGFSFLFNARADHFVGGEITWECQSNGAYVFYMNIYRDCSGMPINPHLEIINISGSPLPTNGLFAITMYPDTAKKRLLYTPNSNINCANLNATTPSCGNGDPAVIEVFPYKSDLIPITGTPPPSGWKFSHQTICCIVPQVSNINSPQSGLYLESIMYPIPNRNMDSCFINSPKFAESPKSRFCRQQPNEFSINALSVDGDSLDYSSIGLRYSNVGNYTYLNGHSAQFPTPDTSIHPSNIPYDLDRFKGDVKLAVYNGTGNQVYLTNTGVSAYKDGILCASVTRAYPIYISDCDTLLSGQVNTAPFVAPPFANSSYDTTVVAGTNLQVAIVVNDSNATGVGSGQQELTITPMSNSQSLDLVSNRMCLNPADTSCATFGVLPIVDSTQNPPMLTYKGFGMDSLLLSWDTDCGHLKFDGSAKTHYFTLKVSDNHCPVPQTTYKTISVTVTPSAACNSITSIKSLQFKDRVSLYPNPTNGWITINIVDMLTDIEVRVRNIQGKVVQRRTISMCNSFGLDLNDQPSGIYFIQLTNDRGERANLKVVKQ